MRNDRLLLSIVVFSCVAFLAGLVGVVFAAASVCSGDHIILNSMMGVLCGFFVVINAERLLRVVRGDKP